MSRRKLSILGFGLLLLACVSGQRTSAQQVSSPLRAYDVSARRMADVTSLDRATSPAPEGVEHKEPALAGVLSFLLPGVGSFYAGNNTHGTIHLGAEVAIYAVAVAAAVKTIDNASSCNTYSCVNNASSSFTTTALVGYGALVVNDIWSIFTAMSDANVHNNATVPTNSKPGHIVGSLYFDPSVLTLPSHAPVTGVRSAPNTGYQLGSVSF